jgi:hypothetical protein
LGKCEIGHGRKDTTKDGCWSPVIHGA